MFGPDIDSPETAGLIPRIVNDMFRQILLSEASVEFTIKIAYCEIYLEKIRDLLDTRKNNLRIKELPRSGFVIENLTEEYAANDAEVFDLMHFGNKNREIGST